MCVCVCVCVCAYYLKHTLPQVCAQVPECPTLPGKLSCKLRCSVYVILEVYILFVQFVYIYWHDPSPQQYSDYMDDIARVDICLAVVIAAHYIIAFPLLVVYYYRVLKHIRKIRRDHGESNTVLQSVNKILRCISLLSTHTHTHTPAEGNTSSSLYGATEAVIVRGHSQAKHRVFLFLTVFVITGLCSELGVIKDSTVFVVTGLCSELGVIEDSQYEFLDRGNSNLHDLKVCQPIKSLLHKQNLFTKSLYIFCT